MEERIFGTESEYAFFFHSEGQGSLTGLDDEAFLDYLKSLTPFLLSSLRNRDWPQAGEFLGNGSRFYIDRGGHPEYATPECRSVNDLVIHEKAGDRIVQGLVESARGLIAQDGRPGKLHIFKNNVDFFGNTYGAHENYLVAPWVMERIQTIIPFLVTRQILAGAGQVTRRQPRDVPYQLTQRADFIDRVFSDRTSRVRGIINTRKREIPRAGQNLRLHLIFGDSNLAEYALRLKIGTTALVLRLLEEGGLEGFPTLPHPVQAMKRISRHLHCSLKMEGLRGRHTACDIQSLYLERAQRFFSSRKPHPEEVETLALWGRTLEGLARLRISSTAGILEEDPDDLRRRLDWVLKLWLLNRAQQQHGFDWHDPRARLLDIRYHDLDPETGLFERCRALDLAERMVAEKDIIRAQSEPPRDTRAWMRGLIIRSAMGRDVLVFIEDWEKINLMADRRGKKTIHFFDRTSRLVNRLKIRLENPFQAEEPVVLESVKSFVENC